MNSYTIEIKNIDIVAGIFKAAPLKMTAEIGRAISRSILTIERNAKREAPVNKQTGGGNLRQSIRSQMLGPASGSVQVNAEYAGFVEGGTRPHVIVPRMKQGLANKRTGQFFGRIVHHPGTKANPFFARAIEKSQPEVDKAFIKAAQNALS